MISFCKVNYYQKYFCSAIPEIQWSHDWWHRGDSWQQR